MFNNKRGNFRLSAYVDEFGMMATFINVPKKLKVAIQNLDQLKRVVYNKFPPIEPITGKDFQNLRYLVNDLRGYAGNTIPRQDYTMLESLIYKDELWVPGKPVKIPPEKTEEPEVKTSDLEDPEEFVPRDPEVVDVPRGFARHPFFNHQQIVDDAEAEEAAIRGFNEARERVWRAVYPNIFGEEPNNQ